MNVPVESEFSLFGGRLLLNPEMNRGFVLPYYRGKRGGTFGVQDSNNYEPAPVSQGEGVDNQIRSLKCGTNDPLK